MAEIPKFENPYEAGYHAGRYGANIFNCNYAWFTTPDKTREWERGNNDGKREKEKQPNGK